MKAMPLPFEDFQGKGVLEFSFSSSPPPPLNCFPQQKPQNCCFVGGEPTSVLDTIRSPSPPTSSSTLSSSQGGANGGGGGGGGGASTDTTTTGVAAASAAAVSGNPSVDIFGEKCGQQQQQLGMEDWESVFSGSPSQEPSILRLIEDPSLGLNKLMPGGGSGPPEMEFNAGFGVVDQVFGFDSLTSAADIDPSAPPHGQSSDFPILGPHNARIISPAAMDQNPLLSAANCSLFPGMFGQQQQPQVAVEGANEKPQIFNPQMIINQHQSQVAQNPAMFLPFSYGPLQEHHLLSPPPTKRHNPGPIGANGQVQKPALLADSRPEFFLQRQQQQQQLQTLNLQHHHQRPAMMKQKFVTEELVNHNPQLHQQALINPLCQAAELIETGNLVLAQGILARLNHQLALPIGKPYHRVAFYFKEALQLLLHNNTITNSSSVSASSLIFKIGAYKSFSEISPILQFANFTCNQALLEAFEGFDSIHIVDFDIGYGGQWASLMQELALRSGGAPSLKITAFASSFNHCELELGFTQENLRIFAGEINMPFELEILSIESLNSGSWPMPLRMSEKEVIAVNLPIMSFSSFPTLLPLVLGFVKQLSPKIVVSTDRCCERTDLPFAHHVNQAIQSYSSLLESLDAVNMSPDSLHKIERFMVQPSIEKIVLGRQRCPDRSHPWRSLFLQSGFSPLTFSNITESQAECLVQRTPVKGFHVEKKQSSLVLCWQRKELVSVSAWRC